MSKRSMDPYCVYRHRSAGRIVSRIDDELIVETERRPFPECIGVKGFEYSFRAVVELAVADQDSQPAGGEVRAGDRGQTSNHTAEAEIVMRPPPQFSLQHPSERQTFAAIRPAEDLIPSGAPT